jgi:hypothetical protein
MPSARSVADMTVDWGLVGRPKGAPKCQRPSAALPSRCDDITIRSKGCLSNRTALAMVFKLLEAAQKSWRRLDGHNQLPKTCSRCNIQQRDRVIAKPDRQPITAAA